MKLNKLFENDRVDIIASLVMKHAVVQDSVMSAIITDLPASVTDNELERLINLTFTTEEIEFLIKWDGYPTIHYIDRSSKESAINTLFGDYIDEQIDQLQSVTWKQWTDQIKYDIHYEEQDNDFED